MKSVWTMSASGRPWVYSGVAICYNIRAPSSLVYPSSDVVNERTRALRERVSAELKVRAERRFADAVEAAGARDPREFYRSLLKELRERHEPSFREALAYYERTLIPTVAADGSDPLGEWLEYGRVLAQLRVDGQTVQIDPTGFSRPYRRPVPHDALVLHLPTSTREPALPIGIPPRLSPAQRASFELLVRETRPREG